MKKFFLIIVLLFAIVGVNAFNLPQAKASEVSFVSDFLKAQGNTGFSSVSRSRIESPVIDGKSGTRIFETRVFLMITQKNSDYG